MLLAAGVMAPVVVTAVADGDDDIGCSCDDGSYGWRRWQMQRRGRRRADDH